MSLVPNANVEDEVGHGVSDPPSLGNVERFGTKVSAQFALCTLCF